MTVTASSSARQFCAMLCLALIVLFAVMQGVNASDRLQHMMHGNGDHPHIGLSLLTMEHADDTGDAHMSVPDGDQGQDGALPTHHHHHGDNGNSLPAPFVTHEMAGEAGALRIGIPQMPAVTGMTSHTPERPPKSAVLPG